MKENETVLSKKSFAIDEKKFIMIALIMLFVVTSAFCQSNTGANENIDGINQIKNIFATIYAFFTSAAVRVIAIAGVIYTGIKIITNKGNPEMMKPLIPIFIACIIIGSASWFVGKFMGSAIKDTSTLTGSSWW